MDRLVKRNSVFRMMKEGKYRALRNIPVGWFMQILHSTDHTERNFRIFLELLLITFFGVFVKKLGAVADNTNAFFVSFVVVHSVSWFFWGNFWVYMLDSFVWIRNPGIFAVLSYINYVRSAFIRSGACDAVLIYGSMCRCAFHERSDLDLRIIRKPGINSALRAIVVGLLVRVPAAIKRIPVDLQVVDSMMFLDRQMRADENPLVVYIDSDFSITRFGIDYQSVLNNPEIILKNK